MDVRREMNRKVRQAAMHRGSGLWQDPRFSVLTREMLEGFEMLRKMSGPYTQRDYVIG